MQLMEHWDPLRLPHGSIRALLTLAMAGVLWTLMLLGREVSLPLAYLVLLLLGHYFGFRGAEAAGKDGKPPLYLPRGSIRTLLILGFAMVGYILLSEGRIRPSSQDGSFVVLLVAAALLAGFLVRKLLDLVTRGKTPAPRRWIENGKAALAIVAVGVFALCSILGDDMPERENLGLVSAAAIVFYLGSRK